MSLKSSDRPSFADLSSKKRKCKRLFFDQVNSDGLLKDAGTILLSLIF